MTVWFVTGTDTDVGKTVVTAALVVNARLAGRSPYVIKPAQTGVNADEPGDLAVVRRLAGGVPGHEGVRLRDPLAPDAAARRQGVSLPTMAEQLAGITDAAAWYDAVLVEGSGGVKVRLGEDWDLLDLAAGVDDARFVVVCRAGLGTLNHTMLTVEAIARAGLTVSGLVIGSVDADPGVAERENVADLPRLTGLPILGCVPAGIGSGDAASFRSAAPTWLPPLPD